MTARISVLALLALTLAACNTVEGVGRDIRAGGTAIERAADGVKSKM